jgi:hypothetical protein
MTSNGAVDRASRATSGLDRLRALEAEICKNYEAFVAVGFALKEIRDEELYKQDGFETWDAYLNERVGETLGIEKAHAFRLIACAQIRPKLSEVLSPRGEKYDWSQKELLEFGRLAPKMEDRPGQPRDYDALKRQDVQRVANKVIEHCKKERVKHTVAVVRKFVDEDLGVKRGKAAAQDNGTDLYDYLLWVSGETEGALLNVKDIDPSAWKLLRKEHPYAVGRWLKFAEELVGVLRKANEA